MTSFWKKSRREPTRHDDPDLAIERYQAEIEAAERAGTGPPPAALNAIGDAFLDKGDPVAAAERFRRAAEAYAGQGLHANAIACARKVRRYLPEDVGAGLLLGRLYAAKGLKADARAELARYAERQRALGKRDAALVALQEIVQLAPEDGEGCERLADALREDGRREPAIDAYRQALEAHRSARDEAAAKRVRRILGELVAEPEAMPSDGPVAEPDGPAAGEENHADERDGESCVRDVETAEEADASVGARPSSGSAQPPATLELEPTSYAAQAAPRESEPEAAPEPLPEDIQHLEEELRQRPRAYGVMLDLARMYAQRGVTDRAGSYIGIATEGMRREGRFAEAAAAYRERARLDLMEGNDFAEWIDVAREAGESRLLLEALGLAARWRLGRGDPSAAREAAEEMLLVDPDNPIATEVLARLGTHLPDGPTEETS